MMELYLKCHGALEGKKVHILKTSDSMRAVMRSSNTKGLFLERQISQDNWLPSLSVESEDGDRWVRLREAFDMTMKSIQWKEKLPDIVKSVCEKYHKVTAVEASGGAVAGAAVGKVSESSEPGITSTSTIIDAQIVIECTARILCLLVFDHICSEDDIQLFVRGRNEWAKTIAVKGFKNHKLRQEVFARFTTLVLKTHPIPSTSTDSGTSGATFTELEWVSAFFQPWFMSPMINITDLFASIPGFLLKNPTYDVYSRDIIYDLLDYEHPFPVLEREVAVNSEIRVDEDSSAGTGTGGTTKILKCGDQAFMFSNDPSFQRKHRNKSKCPGIRFGNGKRACPGEGVATLLMHHMIVYLYRPPHDGNGTGNADNSSSSSISTFQPTNKHFFSGKANDDKNDFQTDFYFHCKLLSLLFVRWGESRRPSIWIMQYCTPDRTRKYLYGTVRLGFLLWFVIGNSNKMYLSLNVAADDTGSTNSNINTSTFVTDQLKPFLFGIVGACVNTKILHIWMNVVLLLLCGGMILLCSRDRVIVIAMYLIKTTVGDLLAGKVDALEWHLGAIFVFLLALAVYQLEQVTIYHQVLDVHGCNLLIILTMHQFIVEYFDSKWENYRFARHRYMYEGFYLLLFACYSFITGGKSLTVLEKEVILCDIVACFGYRLGNAAICLLTKMMV